MLHHMLRSIKPVNTVTYVDHNYYTEGPVNGTSVSLTLSSLIQTKDIIFLHIGLGDSNSVTPPTLTLPADYTLISSQSGYHTAQADAGNDYCLYKIAEASDIGKILTVTSTNCNYKTLSATIFRCSKLGSPSITITNSNKYGSSVSAVNPPNQTVITQSNNFPFIVMAVYSNASTLTFLPPADATLSGYIRYKIFNGLPTTNVIVGSTTVQTIVTLQSFCMLIT